MIHSFVFSPSGTSRKVADIFTKAMGMDSKTHDLTVHGIDSIYVKDTDDLVVFVAPVYAGRVPAFMAKRRLPLQFMATAIMMTLWLKCAIL